MPRPAAEFALQDNCGSLRHRVADSLGGEKLVSREELFRVHLGRP